MDLRYFCCFVAAGAAALPAAAALPEIRTFAPAADTVIFFDDPTGPATTGASNALGEGLTVGSDAGGVVRRSLLRFDLSSIAPGAVIHSAELTLYEVRSRADYDVSLHRLLTAWGEGGSNGGNAGARGAATAGDATWLQAQVPTRPWDTPGGDFVAAASATLNVGPERAFYTWSSPAMAADVQSWVDGPAANHGWILIGLETVNQNAKLFSSREGGIAPVLSLQVSPIPEPSAFAMLALGLGLLAGRQLARRARGG